MTIDDEDIIPPLKSEIPEEEPIAEDLSHIENITAPFYNNDKEMKMRGQVFESVLKAKGINKKDFAKMVGVNYEWFTLVMAGKKTPSFQMFDKWCKRIDCIMTVVMVEPIVKEPKEKRNIYKDLYEDEY